MRIRHVISTVGDSAPKELVEAQQLTLRSIRTALHCVEEGIDVEVRAVHFPDELLDCNWVTDCPVLNRSVLDVGEFEVQRRLPLLFDVLAALGDSSEYDVAVYTNVDITLQPLFYELIAEIHDKGHDATTITRRTVHPGFQGASLAGLSTANSSPHPGHDCFSMTSEVVDSLVPCDAALGVRWVGRCLLWQLELAAKNFRHYGDLHATFHVGDDRAWTDHRLADYDSHNQSAAQGLVADLIERYGRLAVGRLSGTWPFLKALDQQTTPKFEPPLPTSSRALPAMGLTGPRMVFSANSGRVGSAFLASLLGASENVLSGHERPPQMVGPWLRRVAFEPPHVSFDVRRVKADALRGELGLMKAKQVYVDSSHMFVKTFADVVFEEFQHQRLSVVALRRNIIDVARSFFELDFFGPSGGQWHGWMIPPTAPESTFPLAAEEIADQFDLIFGYLADIENRTERLRQETPAVNWVDARLEEITTLRGATELFEQLSLKPPAKLEKAIATTINTRNARKSWKNQPVPRVFVEKRLSEFLDRHGDRRDLAAFVHNHVTEAS
ncbi:MAG: hypothetical protein GWP48_03125 [Actinobacteria bacterium]|nr:hypothetical protein [Actinomycetota bacterium]